MLLLATPHAVLRESARGEVWETLSASVTKSAEMEAIVVMT